MLGRCLKQEEWGNVVCEMWSFSDFQYGFRSSGSTADLVTVVSDTIASALNKYVATQAAALDISKAFDRVWHAGLLAQT